MVFIEIEIKLGNGILVEYSVDENINDFTKSCIELEDDLLEVLTNASS